MRRITSVGLAFLVCVVMSNTQDNEAPKTRIRRLRASTPFSLDSPRNNEHREGLSNFLLEELGGEDEPFWIDLVRRSAESLSMSMPDADGSDDNGDSSDDEGNGSGNGTDDDGNGEGGDGNGTGLSLDCDAVRAGTAPTSGPSMELRADLNITFYMEKLEAGEVSKIVYTAMNDYVRFWMLGCDALGRRLIEATVINVVMNATREAGTCDTSIKDAACVSFDTPTVAIYTPNGGNITSFQDRLDDAIIRADVEGLFKFDGLVDVTVPSESGSIEPIDATGSNQNDKGLSTPGIVSISVTALALLLFAALLARRRRTTQCDETFPRQIICSTCSFDETLTQYSSSEVLGATKRPAVGNNELLRNVSDGMVDDSATLKSTSLGASHAGMDVHVCHSTKCEACVQWKQNKIAFVKPGTPCSPPCNTYQIATMNEASRDFLVLDTITL